MSREPVERLAPVAAAPGGAAGDEAGAPVRQHRCGRCRQVFPVAPDIQDGELGDWWVCPPCRAAILPSRAAQS